ncbi:MAG: AAA family ATPase, partial [Solirubrobacteraceae bacterium]|nr:AAA family ATPase [Solirubrobacteraceae bacterium]
SIVGRDGELRQLRDAIAATATTGTSTIVELAGEAGIGKSSLVRYAQRVGVQRGLTVLAGRASEIEKDLPYGLWIDVLGELPMADHDGVPELRHLLHRRVRTLLAERAGPRGLLLTLDDLHWADQASLDLLRSVADRGLGVPVTIVVAHRPRYPGTAVRVDGWTGDHATYLPLALGPLNAEQLTPLFPVGVSLDERARLSVACGGNPLFLRALLRAGVSAKDLHVGAAPVQAAQVVLRSEIEPLADSARALLQAASIVGDPFDSTVALALADLPAGAHEPLDALISADLVRPTSQPRTYAFRHSLVHAHVYASAPPAWRAHAHAQLASTMTAAGVEAWVVAPHVERSASSGDADAIAVLASAGRATRSTAPASAAHWLAAALALVPSPERLSIDALILAYDATTALTVAGRTEEALAILVDLLARLTPDHIAWPVVLVGTATVERVLARPDDARRRLESALQLIGPGSPAQRGALLIELAAIELVCDRRAALTARADEALACAQTLNDPVLLAGAQTAVAFAACLGPDTARAVARVDEMIETLSALPTAALGRVSRSLVLLADTAWLVRAPAAALAVLDRALPHAIAQSPLITGLELLSARAMLLAQAGRVLEAREVVESASEEARLMGNERGLLSAQLAVATTEEVGGDPQTAVVAGEQAVLLAERSGTTLLHSVAGQVLARARLAAGDPAGARAAIETTHGGPTFPGLPPTLRSETYLLLTCAHLQEGTATARGTTDALLVDELVGAAHASAEADGLDGSWAFAWLASAERSIACGQPVDAALEAADAAAAARRATLPTLEGRALILCGRALAAADRRDDAARALREAEAMLTRAGADRLAADAVRELRAIGRRINRSGRQGVTRGAGQLSARQREVAELAAAGLSNREIADRLYLSPKTIETHLAGAFAALGVSSRTALGAALPRESVSAP